MAERYYGIDRGDPQVQTGAVTEDSSTTATTDVEIRIDLAAGMDQGEVLLLIDALKRAIMQDAWPPA